MKMNWLMALGMGILLNSCSAQAKTGAEVQDPAGHWLVKTMVTESGLINVDNGENNQSMFLDIDPGSGKYSGRGVCNRIMGSLTMGEDQAIQFGMGASTKMACPNMNQEDQLLALLAKTDNYFINKVTLELRHGNKTLITLKRQQPLNKQLDEGMGEEKMSLGMNGWLFQQMESSGSKVDLSALNATLSFDEPGKRLTGFTGCNQISGSFSQQEQFNSGSINMGNIISTRKACPNMTLEHQVQTNLQNVNRYELRNHNLLLYHNDQLVFTLRWAMKK